MTPRIREDVSLGEPKGPKSPFQEDHHGDQTSRMRWVLIRGTGWESISRREYSEGIGCCKKKKEVLRVLRNGGNIWGKGSHREGKMWT